jgi:hypothetical protein
MLDLILKEISCHARALDDKCEDCRSVTASQIVLVDGIPGHHCDSCQRAMLLKNEAEAAEYDARKTDYAKGARVGVCIALVMGALWGGVEHVAGVLSDDAVVKIGSLSSLVAGAAIFWSVFKVLGKKEPRGQMLATLLTLSSRLMARAISWSDFLTHGQTVPVRWLAMGVAMFAVDLLFVGLFCLVPWCKSRPTVTFQPVTVDPDNSSPFSRSTSKSLTT